MCCKLTKTLYYHKIFWLMKYIDIETLAVLLMNLCIYVVLKLYKHYWYHLVQVTRYNEYGL